MIGLWLAAALWLPGGLSVVAPARAADPVVASDARLAGDGERTRLVIDLSRSVPLGAFILADPYRVVVDIPDVVFALPPTAGEEGRGLVSAYRFGLFAPGKARIVMDVNAPVKIDKAFVLDPMDDQPARLVVDLVKTDRATFLAALASGPAQPHRAEQPEMPKAEVAQAGDLRPVIVLDPGHGGVDSGAVNSSFGVTEKQLVLNIARQLQKRLDATGRYRVLLTRSKDTYVSLGQRVRFARDNNARLFISLHADSLGSRDGDVRGATIYTLSDRASDVEAQRLADSENKADMIAGLDLSEEPADVAGILFDLAQRETRNFSAHFARTLAGEVQGAARLHKSPLKSAGFKVLKAPDVPSVLFELGYLSSSRDLELMTSADWQANVTEAMTAAVDAYFAAQKPLDGTPLALPASVDGTSARPVAATQP
ncbi:N-acetylmuramoyl-L-alanine amidase [Starkeya koreensis]|uniref:N-acetylmuramoyl-L-alanine amidase n=1 Tax=Ancylobacter koreensis TaxID=266121 RepID=A0ABT0DNG1_9HYPH|nr:N-acetylmuramoyl-L-alanine amidase [Ancylobacter koreensis]MCK0208807.1 N-acetylmuramoyl-L-alanine amidase [Ancylobacter koreensis]